MHKLFHRIQSFFIQTAIAAIRSYQLIFPAFKYFFIGSSPACCFHPSCSCYAQKAYEAHGILKGTFLTFFRILRCHPFTHGGNDPVPKLFLINKAWKSSSSEHY